MHKKHCSPDCRVKWQIERAKVRKVEYPSCSADGCTNGATRVKAGLCEKHYCRVRRGAPLTDPKRSYKYVTKAGYIILLRSEHPLAMSEGRVAEHRIVAYEKHEGKCPSCFWCALSLSWEDAVVDHLDEDKQNNKPTNLVVSCNRCNRARGALLPFIAGMRPDALTIFFKQITMYREKRSLDLG